jgi:hypothetical protein
MSNAKPKVTARRAGMKASKLGARLHRARQLTEAFASRLAGDPQCDAALADFIAPRLPTRVQ